MAPNLLLVFSLLFSLFLSFYLPLFRIPLFETFYSNPFRRAPAASRLQMIHTCESYVEEFSQNASLRLPALKELLGKAALHSKMFYISLFGVFKCTLGRPIRRLLEADSMIYHDKILRNCSKVWLTRQIQICRLIKNIR